jgi:hypothetical protein
MYFIGFVLEHMLPVATLSQTSMGGLLAALDLRGYNVVEHAERNGGRESSRLTGFFLYAEKSQPRGSTAYYLHTIHTFLLVRIKLNGKYYGA